MVTIGTAVLFCSTLPTLISVLLSIHNYRIYRYRHYLYMALTWMFLVSGELLLTYAYLSLDLLIYKFGVLLTAPLVFFLVILLDSITRLDLDLKKFSVTIAVITALFITAFEEGSVGYNISALGEKGPIVQDNFFFWSSLIFALSGYFWLFYMVKLYLNSPISLKKYARYNLYAAVLAGPGASVAFISGLVWIFPGTDYLLIATASSVMAYSFHKEPRLAFILPFKVYSIYAIETESGINVYSYHWQKTEGTNDLLFTSAIQGISMVLSESLGEVSIREIILQEGHLLILRKGELSFILFVSAVSNVVLDALSEFAEQFTELYVRSPSKLVDSLYYNKANKIIDERFPFVVDHL